MDATKESDFSLTEISPEKEKLSLCDCWMCGKGTASLFGNDNYMKVQPIGGKDHDLKTCKLFNCGCCGKMYYEHVIKFEFGKRKA